MAALKEGGGAWRTGAVLLLLGVAPARADHWDWAYAELGHAMPVESFDVSSPECQACVAATGQSPESPEFRACVSAQEVAAQGDPTKAWCKPQPLISRPPDPDPAACLEGDAIADEIQFVEQCLPNFTDKMAAIAD
ncbi:MAG: hypothetical protein ACREQQ_09400, partial [Candidatus Binatia bacterium]